MYTEGGAAAIAATFLMAGGANATADDANRTAAPRRRRESDSASRLAIGLALTPGATADEVVRIRPIQGAVRDDAGWAASHRMEDAVLASGSLVQTSRRDKVENRVVGSGTSVTASVAIIFGVSVAFFCVARACGINAGAGLLSRLPRRLREPLAYLPTLRIERRGVRIVPQQQAFRRQSQPARPPASRAALAIAADFEWLRPPSRAGKVFRLLRDRGLRRAATTEMAGQWMDMMADASVDSIHEVQRKGALPVRVLDAAHAAHVLAVGPGLSDDVSALRVLHNALSAAPSPLPRPLLLAASYCDQNVRAEALCLRGDAAAASYLGTLLSAGRQLPAAVEAALHGIAAAGTGSAAGGARSQLALLLRRREPFANAVSIARPLVSECLEAMDEPEFVDEDVMTDGEVVQQVLAVVAAHLKLGLRQVEAESRISARVHAALDAFGKARAVDPWSKNSTDPGFPPTGGKALKRTRRASAADPDHLAAQAVAACRRIESELVSAQLATLGLRQFSGRLPLSGSIALRQRQTRKRASAASAKPVQPPRTVHVGSLGSDLPSPRSHLASPRLEQAHLPSSSPPAHYGLPAPAALPAPPEPAAQNETQSPPQRAGRPTGQPPALERGALVASTDGAGCSVDNIESATSVESLCLAVDGGNLYSATDSASVESQHSAADGNSLESLHSAVGSGSVDTPFSAAVAPGGAGTAISSALSAGGLHLLARMRRAYAAAPSVLRARRGEQRELQIPLDSKLQSAANSSSPVMAFTFLSSPSGAAPAAHTSRPSLVHNQEGLTPLWGDTRAGHTPPDTLNDVNLDVP
jgi:hypothetical protein